MFSYMLWREHGERRPERKPWMEGKQMAQFETWLNVDLKKPLKVHVISGTAFSQDNRGNLVGAVVTDGGLASALEGTVMGYCVRADGQTVVVHGGHALNRAWIELPEAAYAAPGMMQIAIRLVNGDQKTVLAAFQATVQRTSTDTLVDPGEAVPDLEDILFRLEFFTEPDTAALHGGYRCLLAVQSGFIGSRDDVERGA